MQVCSWWAVYTRSRREKALARQLHECGIPFYLPLVARDHTVRGRKMRSYVPLFSGYLFVFGSEDERNTALTTNCISRILPVPDPEQLREDLLQVHQLTEAGVPLNVEQRLRPGRAVRIKSGAMKGITGTVIQRSGKDHLLVAVNYLQQGVSVAIDNCIMEPVG